MSDEAKREIDDFLKIFGTSLRHYSMPGTVDKAVAAWNRRTPSPDYPDDVKELVRAARECWRAAEREGYAIDAQMDALGAALAPFQEVK